MDMTVRLTSRESDVLRVLARGCTYSQVSDRLGVSLHTVTTHIKNVYRKLEVLARLKREEFDEEVQIAPTGVGTAGRCRAEKLQPANPVPGADFPQRRKFLLDGGIHAAKFTAVRLFCGANEVA